MAEICPSCNVPMTRRRRGSATATCPKGGGRSGAEVGSPGQLQRGPEWFSNMPEPLRVLLGSAAIAGGMISILHFGLPNLIAGPATATSTASQPGPDEAVPDDVNRMNQARLAAASAADNSANQNPPGRSQPQEVPAQSGSNSRTTAGSESRPTTVANVPQDFSRNDFYNPSTVPKSTDSSSDRSSKSTQPRTATPVTGSDSDKPESAKPDSGTTQSPAKGGSGVSIVDEILKDPDLASAAKEMFGDDLEQLRKMERDLSPEIAEQVLEQLRSQIEKLKEIRSR